MDGKWSRNPSLARLVMFAGLLPTISSATPIASVESQDSITTCQRTKVVILGAGMAGISAGEVLTKKGIDDFAILEYQDRLGGRTLQATIGNNSDSSYTVELGTNWINYIHLDGSAPSEVANSSALKEVNPVWRLALATKLLTVSDTEGNTSYYDQHGLRDWSNATTAYLDALALLSTEAETRLVTHRQDLSVRAGLRLVGWDASNDTDKQSTETAYWEGNAAASALDSSLIYGINSASFSSLKLGEQSRFVVDQRGYSTVTEQLASHYLQDNDPRLRLNTVVTDVSTSDDEVTIRTSDGDCIQAEHAICTFSLGVLQKSLTGQAPVTFTPSFPQWKAESITANIMGTLTKVFFQFRPEDVFWPRDMRWHTYAPASDEYGWIRWEALDYYGSPLEGSGIIFSFLSWDDSRRIEEQTDDETKEEGLKVLKRMFPNQTIPDPVDFMYPRWGKLPWSFGSYSNWATGYTPTQQTNFRANLGRLWFAGEATSRTYWGYLHGAYFEGEEVGNEIADCLGSENRCVGRPTYENLSEPNAGQDDWPHGPSRLLASQS